MAPKSYKSEPKSQKMSPKASNVNQTAFAHSLDQKFELFKAEVLSKIDEEVRESTDATKFINDKYENLCQKIATITDVDEKLNNLKNDMTAAHKSLKNLTNRISEYERRSMVRPKKVPSVSRAV